MALKYIDISRTLHGDEQPNSHLTVSDDPAELRVSGELPHGTMIAPATIDDAVRLRAWVDAWIKQRARAEGRAG